MPHPSDVAVFGFWRPDEYNPPMARRLGFLIIVWLYTFLVALYAVNTPPWQIPDEPAHYNYVRTVAEQGALPVLQAGDYNQAYLDDIKSRKFPADMAIDTIRYESHQPPLYYVLDSAVYDLGAGTTLDVRLLSLRLFSALWGAVLLAIVYRIAVELFPVDPLMPLLAAGLAGFVPQHLAMLAGVNNDSLADVILAGVVLGLLRVLRFSGTDARAEQRAWWAVGILAGLGLVTKTTTYVSAGLIVVTLLVIWQRRRGFRHSVSLAAPALLFALVIGGLWFTRDAMTYGPTDWLGLARHDAVVVGQPRTLELYPNYLVAATFFFPILFRSFWGQFGWMGVLLDDRLYNFLFGVTLIAFSGLLVGAFRALRRHSESPTSNVPYAGLLLLSAWFLFTLIATVAYSLEFFQAQGRYLFPALGAIAIFMALGLCAWLDGGIAVLSRTGGRALVARWGAFAMIVVCFVGLDMVCLFRFLVPALRG